MAQYLNAREQTRRKIETAFWELYIEKSFQRVTVAEITERAGVHRSTFYTYYDSVGCIFDSIKEHQLRLLKEVLKFSDDPGDEYENFLYAFETLYEENALFLKPLLVEYHSSSFSKAYRQLMKDQLRQDAKLPLYPENSLEYKIMDSTLSGFIEMFIQSLDCDAINLKDS